MFDFLNNIDKQGEEFKNWAKYLLLSNVLILLIQLLTLYHKLKNE